METGSEGGSSSIDEDDSPSAIEDDQGPREPSLSEQENLRALSSQRWPYRRQSTIQQSRKSKAARSRSAQSVQKELKIFLSKDYLSLLNDVIQDVNTISAPAVPQLDSSQLGASFWSSKEKNALFQGLEKHGLNNMPSLCRTVPTKSESEIQVYLTLLQENPRTRLPHRASTFDFSLADVPSAVEISGVLERSLDLAADALAVQVNKKDMKCEQETCGDGWLIDEEVADEIEKQFAAAEFPKDGERDSDADANVAESSPEKVQYADSVTALLRPATFLQLSRSLFMNNDTDAELNWSTCNLVSADVEAPAMYRSALEDLHNLVVNFTRRLVQETIYQAMTRLRAGDSRRSDWEPAAAVREVDVRTTLDMLNLEPRQHEYWARAPRRCGVTVTSDAKKYADGRPGSKVGRKLTYTEVEEAMRLTTDSLMEDSEDVRFVEDEVDGVMEQSDMFTDGEDGEHAETESSDGETNETKQAQGRSRKRPRSLSLNGFGRAENAYLEAVDRGESLDEEARLSKLLHIDSPAACIGAKPEPLPSRPILASQFAQEDRVSWREKLAYEAEWEHPLGLVDPGRFQQMELQGRRGRKRRKVLEEMVRERLRLANVPRTDQRGDGRDGGHEKTRAASLTAENQEMDSATNGTTNAELSDLETSVDDDQDDDGRGS